MSCTEYQSALSELLDGTLPRERRAQVDAHVGSCDDCRAMLADIRRIRETARALPKVVPAEVLWQKVRADFEREAPSQASQDGKHRGLPHKDHKHGGLLHEEGKHGGLPHEDRKVLGFIPRRRNVLAGLAAAAMLVLATSAGVYYVTRPDATAPQAMGPAQTGSAPAHAEPADAVQSIDAKLQQADQLYGSAITDLEKMASEGQAVLDPTTAAVLAKNNAILDQAISESRAALRTQPTSEVARSSLFEALQRKVTLLRDTVALINEMRKGDAAGTARVVGKLGKS